MLWPTPSTTRWATSARRSCIPPPSRSGRSITASRSPHSSRTWPRGGWRCSSFSAAIRYTRRRPTSRFAEHLREGAAAHPSRPVSGRDGCRSATGTSRRRITWRAGAMPAAYDGTASDRPAADRAAISAGRSRHELLAAFGERPNAPGYEIVRGYWRGWWLQQTGKESGDFETFWQTALHDGRRHRPEVCAPDAEVGGAAADRVAKAHRGERGRRPREPADLRSSSVPIRRSTTAGSPTTAGSRNCPSR